MVRAVQASDVAELAADATIGIDARNALVIQIQITPFAEARNGLADQLIDGSHALFIQVIAQAFDHVFDNAVAIMHNGRANLNTL